jgi:chaperonin cofactor prefoldin
MTNAGMFEDADKIEKLEKTIDTLETQNDIKDYHINKLKEEIKGLQEALEKTE